MSELTRRSFLKTGVAAGALAGSGSVQLAAERPKATDWVTLGRSGVKVTRLAFGTGTISGRVEWAATTGTYSNSWGRMG